MTPPDRARSPGARLLLVVMAHVVPLATHGLQTAPVAGQGVEERATLAEPFTIPDHWSREALRRLAGMGLLEPGEVATAWPLPRDRVRALLAAAAAREEEAAARDSTAIARTAAGEGGLPHSTGGVARGFLRRFEAEHPSRDGARAPRASGRVSVGWSGARGGWLAGTHERWMNDEWIYRGAVAAPEVASALLRPELELSLASSLGFRASGVVRDEGVRGEEVYAFAALGPTAVWAGRRHLALGPPTGRGLVLSGAVPFQGGGMELVDPIRLPGFLGRAGPVRGSTVLARMERSGEIGRPWFWAARVSFAPGDELAVGLNRASIFGGEGNEPVTARNVLLMLLGLTDTRWKSSAFENQVASVDVVWRPAPSPLPLLVYGEWGFTDVGGAWFRVPGVVGGAELTAVPGVPALSSGVEYASFSGHGRGHPPWYRHGPLGEGWTDRGRLLGHPLGGHGTAWSAHLALDPGSSPARATLRGFRRNRGEENLLVRGAGETSWGGELRILAHGPHRLVVDTELKWETGRPEAGGERWRHWTARFSLGAGR